MRITLIRCDICTTKIVEGTDVLAAGQTISRTRTGSIASFELGYRCEGWHPIDLCLTCMIALGKVLQYIKK